MAKATKGSLAVRAVALVFAVALAALAARLWLGSAPRETSGTRAAGSEGDAATGDVAHDRDAAAADPVATAPPLHGDPSPEDREALRDILRESESEAP